MKIYWELFSVFMRIGAFTFGGGYAMLPLIQKEIVDKKHWATEEEIMDYYAVLTTYSSLAMVQHALAGIRVAVCVLVLNAVVKLWKSGIKDTFGILLFAVVLAAITFTSVSTVLIVIIAALLGVIVCALRRREVKE